MSRVAMLVLEKGVMFSQGCLMGTCIVYFLVLVVFSSYSLHLSSSYRYIEFIAMFRNAFGAEEQFLVLSALYLYKESDNSSTERAKANFMPFLFLNVGLPWFAFHCFPKDVAYCFV